uniref:Uncharacterized protein n=1 Tax=uncultured Desulfobacterium sp. TaxID=201089 RepID=E1YA71_9BACT|nr:unknown protein [uncultured Desulfobacterium sp.]
MKASGKWDMTFRKGVLKLPMSHLFYVLGEKNNQNQKLFIKSQNQITG